MNAMAMMIACAKGQACDRAERVILHETTIGSTWEWQVDQLPVGDVGITDFRSLPGADDGPASCASMA